jgi:hypothetical protein
MSTEENVQEIEEYLKDLENYLNHLAIRDRNSIIEAIRSEILKALSMGQNELDTVIRSLGSELDLLNRHLIQAGLPLAIPYKKKNFFKIFVLSMMTLIISGIVVVLILVKSITPLWKFDEEAMTLTLLGGKIKLDQTDDTFFNSTRLKKSEVQGSNIDMSGEIPMAQFQRIRIIGQNVDLAFRSNPDLSIIYQCKASEAPDKFVEEDQEGLNFKLVGSTQCLFQIPENLKLLVNFKNGFVNLRELNNDLDVTGTNGNITFDQKNKSLYSLDSQTQQGVIEGDTDGFVKKGRFQAVLYLQSGVIKILE